MDNETKNSLRNGIRSCVIDLENSESALSVVSFNLQSNDESHGEYAITHLAINNINQVRQILNKLEREYL